MFERIVQSSIMRLNRESMDKLYDLMTMVFKYQVLMVPSPRQIVGVTLNHLDTIEGYVKENLEASIPCAILISFAFRQLPIDSKTRKTRR